MSQEKFHKGLDKFLFNAKICANLNAYRAQELRKAYSAADEKDVPLILYYIKNVGDVANLLEKHLPQLKEADHMVAFKAFDNIEQQLLNVTVTNYLELSKTPIGTQPIDELSADEKIDKVTKVLEILKGEQFVHTFLPKDESTVLPEDLVLTNRFTTQQIILAHDHIAGFHSKDVTEDAINEYVSDAASSVGEFCMGAKGFMHKFYATFKMKAAPCDEALPDFAKCVKQYQYIQFSGCADFKDEKNQVECSEKLEKLYKEGDMQNQCDPYLIATDFDGFGNCVTSVLAYQPEADL